MKLNRIKIIILAILLSTTFVYANFIRCAMINFSNFKKIEKNLYVENTFKDSEHKHIQSLITDAKVRIADKFGKLSSNPTIIIAKNPDTTLKYSTNLYANTYTSPWGNYVIIGSKGHSVDVIAHELLHAEVSKRLGYFTKLFQFPVWLDEGIGMQVDYRKRYNISSISDSEIIRVQTLNSVSSFWTNSKKQTIKNYQGAKYVVYKILAQYPEKELFSLLLKVKNGENIKDIFSLKTNKTN